MTTVDVAYEEPSPSSSACGPGEGDFDNRVRSCLVALGSTSPEQDMLKGTAMLMNAKNAGLAPGVAAATLYATLHHAHPKSVALTGAEEPPDAGPIDYTRIQSMARYYARQQGLGEYVPNSAVPIGAGWWAFYTTVPGSAPERREVSHDELSREWMLQTHAGVRRRPQPGQLREEAAPTHMKLGIAGEGEEDGVPFTYRDYTIRLTSMGGGVTASVYMPGEPYFQNPAYWTNFFPTREQAIADAKRWVDSRANVRRGRAGESNSEAGEQLLCWINKGAADYEANGAHGFYLLQANGSARLALWALSYHDRKGSWVDIGKYPSMRAAKDVAEGYERELVSRGGRFSFSSAREATAHPEWMTHVVYKSKLEGRGNKKRVKRDEKLESLITAIVGAEPAEVLPGSRDKSITLVYAAPDEATAKLKAEQVGLHVRGVKARYGRWEGVVRSAGRPMANDCVGVHTHAPISPEVVRALGVADEERLTYSQRKNLPRSAFALPDTRDLPLTNAKGKLDPGHIHAAASRLSEMKHLGHLTKAQYEEGHARIQRAAKKVGIHVNEAAEDCGCEKRPDGIESMLRNYAQREGMGAYIFGSAQDIGQGVWRFRTKDTWGSDAQYEWIVTQADLEHALRSAAESFPGSGWYNVFAPASQPLGAKVVGHVDAKDVIDADRIAHQRFGRDVFVFHTGGRGYRYAIGTRLLTPPRDRNIIDDIGAAAQESKLEWYNVYSPQSDPARSKVVGHVQATWIVGADQEAKAKFGPQAFAQYADQRYAIGTLYGARGADVRIEGQTAPTYPIQFETGDFKEPVNSWVQLAGVGIRQINYAGSGGVDGTLVHFTSEQLQKFLRELRSGVAMAKRDAERGDGTQMYEYLQRVLNHVMKQVNRGANEEPAEAPPIVINKTMVVAEEPVDFSGINSIPSLDRDLKWHRESDGSYFTQSSLGRFTLKKRTPDRRHNVNPWLLELDGKEIKSRFASGFDTKDEAQAYATIYVEMRPHLQVNEASEPVFDQCVPWVKVTRDPDKYRACMAMAEKAGPCDSARKVYDLLHKHLMTEDQEIWIVVMTDLRDQIRGVVEVGRGQRDRVSVSAVDTLRPVLITGAKNFYVVHNHPSGNAEPSRSDKSLTKGIKEVAAPYGDEINFKGHVVIGNGQYVEVGEGKKHYVK